jgi:hypothetical protein
VDVQLSDCLITVRVIGAAQGGTGIALVAVIGMIVRWLQLEQRARRSGS